MNEFVVTLNGQKKNISLSNGSEVTIDGIVYEYELIKLSPDSYILRLNNSFYEIPSELNNGESTLICVEGASYEVTVRSALQEKAASLIDQKNALSHRKEIKAPMPGMVIKINHQENSEVHPGQAVIILEAMKMENEVRTPVQGIIKKIFVKEGMAVEKGANLFLVE